MLADDLEVGLFRLFLDFEQQALVCLDECIVVTDEQTFLFHVLTWHLFMEQAFVKGEQVVHVD